MGRDVIDESSYKHIQKKLKNKSNEQVILESLTHIIYELDRLQQPYLRSSGTTEGLLSVLYERIEKS